MCSSLSNCSVYKYEDSSPPKSTNSIPFVLSGWWIRSSMNSIPIDDHYHGMATDVHRIGQAYQIHGMDATINLEWNYLVWQSNISPWHIKTLKLFMTIRVCLQEPYSIVKTTTETPMTRYHAIVQVSDVTIVDWSSPVTCGAAIVAQRSWQSSAIERPACNTTSSGRKRKLLYMMSCVTELQRPTDSFDVQLARREPRLNWPQRG